MDARFLLPVSIATALHALVLFGVKWPHPTVTTTRLTTLILDPFPMPAEPPEPVAPSSETALAAPKGKPEEFVPVQDEPPVIESIFEQEPARRRPAIVNVVEKISGGPIGIPDGVDIRAIGTALVNSDVLDNPPRTRSQISPNYPATERNAGITGDVLVEFIVDETGRVQRAHAVSSSHSAFESPAVRAVEKWRFEPGKRNGRPVRFRMAIPIHFSLDQSSI